jgi:CRP-like cAMP-binding protein
MIDAVSVMCTEVVFEPDEFVYHQHEVAKDMYFIMQGTIDELSESGDVETVHQTLRPGSTTGDVSFFFKMR